MASENVQAFHQQFAKVFSGHVGMAYQEIVRGLEDRPGHIAIWGIEELQERAKKASNIVHEFDVSREIFNLWHELEQVEYALAFLHEAFSKKKEDRHPLPLLEIVFDQMSAKMRGIEKWAKEPKT